MIQKRFLCWAVTAVLLIQLVVVLQSVFSSFTRTTSIDYVWVGGVQSTSAAFRVRAPKDSVREFRVATDEALTAGVVPSSVTSLTFDADFQLFPVQVTGLTPPKRSTTLDNSTPMATSPAVGVSKRPLPRARRSISESRRADVK